MTNVDLVYQALVIHPKWVRFTNAQDPVMTGRRWYGSDMDALWLKPNFFDKRHIWGQQEVFESQLEYHAGAAHFLGPGHRCCPPFFFGGFQRQKRPKLSSCKRRTPTGYACWKRHRPRKRGYPDFIIKLWNIRKIPPNPMVEKCWKPQVPRHCIELSYIILLVCPPFYERNPCHMVALV